MTDLRRLLPSLDHLAVFEAAGRLGSFSRAAEELRVTQAAVSYAVRALETDLGATLFNRSRRGVALTPAGERFHAEVSMALSHIRQSAERVRRSAAPGHVTLSVSTAFATLWILPRLARLREDLPEIDLRVQTTDRDLDLRAEGLEIGIRYGGGVLPHYGARPLAEEVLYPVCSPGYRSRAGADAATAPADLLPLTLLHLDEPHRPCPTWSDWFAAHGVAYRDHGAGLRLNDYALVVQAALEGQGVALGWAHLTDRLVAAGLLMRPIDAVWRTGVHFQAVWTGTLDGQRARVLGWLVAEGAADERAVAETGG